jgi:hypothetical protein
VSNWAGYRAFVITAVLGAPGSGKSTVAQLLAARWPAHVVLDWDAFMDPSAALAGRGIRQSPDDVEDAIRDASEYRALGLPALDTTGQPPDKVAADLADFVQRLEQAAPER